jgi:hypothetical protein
MKYAKGICWVDDTRIPFDNDVDLDKKLPKQDGGTIYGGGKGFYRTDETSEYKTGGRFTPSLLVCDDMLNDGSVSKSTKVKSPLLDITGGSYNNAKGNTNKITERGVDDKGTNSRYYDLDKWFDKVINEIC